METWSIAWVLRNLFAELLMPPVIWLVLGLLVFFLIKNDLAKNLFIASSLLIVWIGSTNYFSNQLTTIAGYFLGWLKPLLSNKLENKNQKSVATQILQSSQGVKAPQAKIIFGGGSRIGAVDALTTIMNRIQVMAPLKD